jgi:predicted dienelactone hydrolase
LVFAHGDSGHPRKVTRLLDAWARAGYVVAAPAFPLTNDDVNPTAVGDYAEQPSDLSFVIDQLLEESRSASDALGGKVDSARVGLAGHSLGAASASALGGNTNIRDERVDAFIALSGFPLNFPTGSAASASAPLLAVHGTNDARIPIDLGRRAYERWAGPKWFLTLKGADHSSAFEDAVSPYDELVIDATTSFWDAELRRDPEAGRRFATVVSDDRLAQLECSATVPRDCQLVEDGSSGRP